LNERATTVGTIYMTVTGLGFILILTGGTLLSRFIQLKFHKDIFNELNETFPQEERLIENEFSINLPAQYNLKGKIRRSFINIVAPHRSTIIVGGPGSGKSWYCVQFFIKQSIQKQHTMLLYDFKFPDLSTIAYNSFLKNASSYKVRPSFHAILFDDPSRSSQCNPLNPGTMYDITDATEASRSILLGLNHEWVSQQGDFFVESPINFVTAIIWFLKKYKTGKYCTLPHVIELMQIEYEKLFPVLRTQKEIEVLINPFISAYQNNAMEQLEGQIASAKIGMARLSSPLLYWTLSGNDFTLDINNPLAPKIVCLGNNPEKQDIYGAVISLYKTTAHRLMNKKGQQKSSIIDDEAATIVCLNLPSLIATGRSNLISVTLAFQDLNQLRKHYGKEQADVIMNIAGNIICGQVTGDTAKFISENIGKIVQIKESVSINRTDTSISKSSQLDYAVPQAKIANLSSGEFVGKVADTPVQKIKLKTFHCGIINDNEALNRERIAYKELPIVNTVTHEMVRDNYYRIKQEVAELIEIEIDILLDTPGN